MTLSIRNTLRSLSLLAMTAAFLPGCDSEEYEALGLSSEEIDAMSEEELDELAALEDDDDLEHSVDPRARHIAAPLPPNDPDVGPDDLTAPAATGHTDHFDVPTTLWAPHFTHTGPNGIDVSDTLWAPRFTHAESAVEIVEGIAIPVHPTHDDQALALGQLGLPDPGCKPKTEYAQLSNG
ncbi:MAG TPA: hypothetical protein VGB85_01840 [Nannocystis sp.]|jgi:hypothetical protein